MNTRTLVFALAVLVSLVSSIPTESKNVPVEGAVVTEPINLVEIDGNSTSRYNTTRPKPTHPIPLYITTPTTPKIISNGICLLSCRPSQALHFDSWNWFTSSLNTLSYKLSFRVLNPNIADEVIAVVADDRRAGFGILPRFGETATTFSEIHIQPHCRMTSAFIVEVIVDDPVGVYLPVRFFVKLVCAVEVSPECEGVDCGPYGVCKGSSGTCDCITNYYGTNCSSSIFDQCPDRCNGRGVKCINSGSRYQCVCAAGFGGESCQISTGCVHLGMCSGHGECIDDMSCACDLGWTGLICNETSDIMSRCAELGYCKYHGECTAQDNAYVCVCAQGYTGVDCSQVVPTCPANCSGHGICKDDVCVCNFGFNHEDCSNAYSPCGGCLNGFCTESIDDSKPHCVCDAGSTGTHCELYDPTTDPCAQLNFCNSQGTCTAGVCTCFSGFNGSDCSVVIPVGCVNNCGGHGQCDTATDTCVCDIEWSGADCSISRCPVSETGEVCSGKGVCVPQANTGIMGCTCLSDMFFGTACQNGYCFANKTCSGHGSCTKSSGLWSKLCECNQGWAGFFCETRNVIVMASSSTQTIGRTSASSTKGKMLEDSEDDFLDTAP
eukprot:c7472_g1_i1.p1 GENE.c7472_g1_i1~~c7472_g1_i1.p1  ORF type:complete len:607 (-),score=132.55 c7472_g1_i1:45-1865(-)